MKNPRHHHTPEIEAKIVSAIRSGAYEYVAAEAAGVPKETYDEWLRKGSLKRTSPHYKAFFYHIMEAKAQARLLAEVEVRRDDPKFWLRCGPGKERQGHPGWSQETKPITQDNRQLNLLMSPEWNSLWAVILQSLSAFPDARIALAAALESNQQKLIPPPKG